jgi:hypothetical protein
MLIAPWALVLALNGIMPRGKLALAIADKKG